MAFLHGKNTQVLCNQYELTSYFTKTDLTRGQDLHDATTFGNNSKVFFPGLKFGDLSMDGLFAATGAVPDLSPQAALAAAFALDPGLVALAPRGFAIGNEVYMLQAEEKDYKISSPVSNLTSIVADFQSSKDVGIEGGVSLHPTTPAETVSTNSASVDNVSSSPNGAIGYLHVIQYATLTNAIIKVQHSTNNSTWVDLITFATVTGLTSQAIAVAGTINEFVRVISTLTGGGSINYAVGFARR